jgi:hypothetical protein
MMVFGKESPSTNIPNVMTPPAAVHFQEKQSPIPTTHRKLFIKWLNLHAEWSAPQLQ